MAEMLIRVVDKTNPDPALDAQCMKRGDVVAVCPDGWPWSVEERTAPYWRIIRAPGSAAQDHHDLTVPRQAGGVVFGGVAPISTERLARKRAAGLDLDHALLTPQDRAWLADDSRAQPMRVIPLARLMGIKRVKPMPG